MTITVYGTSLSPYTRKVMATLTIKGVAYEMEQVNPFGAPDWFPAISPYRKIPVLRDSEAGPDATVPDSSVICAYLERRYPEPALYPRDDFAYAKALWYEEFADTALAETIGRPFFYARVVRRLMGEAADEAAAEDAARNKQPPRFTYLDKELEGRAHFVGETLTTADLAVASMFVNFKHAGGNLDASRYPNLAAFVERMHAHPALAPLIAAETAFLQKTLNRAG